MSEREFSGILCLNKPSGVTSHDMIYKMRRLFNTKKVGHTGTLDPLATGVLVILIGRAAKASDFLLAKEKEYVAGITLGVRSDTLDITGRLEADLNHQIPCEQEFLAVLPSFVGEITQIPPMYSAIKKDGKKLYELARQGVSVEREERTVSIGSIEYLGKGKGDNEYLVRVRCSKGTYIRTLCADIGEALGCGAVMSSLCRTKNASFTIEHSHTLEELEGLSLDGRYALLTDVEQAFSDLPCIVLPEFFEKLARCGNEIYLKKIGKNYDIGSLVRLSSTKGFFALGRVEEYPDGPAIKPLKQFDI